VHIGVNTGHVVARMFGDELRTDYSVLGESVNLAQRLESAAAVGETYVGDPTYQLTRDRFAFEDLGGVAVKGKDEPIQAWKLVGRRDVGEGRAPAAPRRLLGRDEELAALTRVLTRTQTPGGVAAVTGEAGAGKSRLTQEARTRAGEAGARWLQARCLSYGAALAYWPYVDLVRRSFGIRIEEDPVDAGGRLADALAGLGIADTAPYLARLVGVPLPAGLDDLGDLEPEAFRRGLHAAVGRWVEALGAEGPVVLAVEDLHWLDAASLDLTRDLAARCATAPLSLCLTARPEGRPAIDVVARAVPDLDRAVIALGPLDAPAIGSLVEAVLGGPASPALLEGVLARSAGNPFFTEELARSLRDGGALSLADGAWALAPGRDLDAVPATVEGVLAARIDLLARPLATVLQRAAVVGRHVKLPLLAAAVGDDVLDLPAALDDLVRAGFLDRVQVDGEEVVMFHHALVVDVAYSRLVRRQRRELHRRVAEAAEEIYGSGDDVLDLLARHFYLAEAGVKAVDYLVQAADRSRGLYANEEAIIHLRRAAELARAYPRTAGRLPGLLLGIADLEDLTGDYDEASALYDEVRGLTGQTEAWRGIVAMLRKRGRFADALTAVDQAMQDPALRGAGADLAPLWLERAWTLMAEGHFHDAIDAASEGLAVTRAPDGLVAAHLLLQRTRAQTAVGRGEYALADGERARTLFEAGGDLRGLTLALRILGTVHTDAARYEDAASVLARGLQLAERTGDVQEQAACLVNLGLVELARGDIAAAVECDRRAAAEFERIGHATGQATAYANLAEALLHAGDLDEAQRICEKGLALAGELGDAYAQADLTRTLAGITLRQGTPADAAVQAEDAAALFEEVGDEANAADARRLAGEARAAPRS
jgi:adenylate cyclase